MLRFASRSARLLLITLSAIPVTARAQAGSFASGTAVGVTVQAIGSTEGLAEVPAVALHVTSIGASGLGVDVTLGTVPTVLAAGVFLLAPDVSIARLFPVGGGAFMVKVGPSGIIAAAEGGAAGVLGAHVGAVALVRLGNRLGIRAEVVPRFYGFDGEIVQLTTFGIGLTSLPERHR
jgi:hypothetical protein